MAYNKALMVVGVLLLACLLAEGDAQEKVRPQTHGGGWGGGGWGGGGPGGWGGGGRGGGWGGGGGGWGGGGGGWGGGGWGGGGRGGGWGGGGGCGYRCGHRCCTPQETKKIEAMNVEGRKTLDVKPADNVVGTDGYGGGGYGGGGRGGGWGGGGGCRYWCGSRCCRSPEEVATFQKEIEIATEETVVDPQGYVSGGYGGGYGGGGYGGGYGGGRGGWGGGGGCRYRCGGHCCTPQEIVSLIGEKDVKADTVVGTQGHGGGGGGGYGGGGGGGYGGGGHGGGCRYWCGRRCCTPKEIAKNPDLNRSETGAEGKETSNTEVKADPNTVKQGEVKN